MAPGRPALRSAPAADYETCFRIVSFTYF